MPLEGGQEAIRLLVRLAVEERERVAEDLRSKGRRHGHTERVDMRHHDDGSLVRDGLAEAHLRERAPVGVFQRRIGVREEAMAFGICSAYDHGPSKHRVAAVPALGLDGRTEAVFSR